MDSVAPGGSLLVTGHGGIPDTMRGTPFDVHLPTAAELRVALDPAPSVWTIATERTIVGDATGPDGTSFARTDSMLRLLRAQTSV
jgi:hypothetical protein